MRADDPLQGISTMRSEISADGNPGPVEVPRFSVVIPTHQRRDVVVRNVRALERQTFPEPFEVIVVVDGSTDGTTAALRALSPRFRLRVLEQPNRGAAAARNHGAAMACGAILLFLDDDMEADPGLLAEHDHLQSEGAAAVIGHMPVHPDAPDNFLTRNWQRWAEDRRKTLSTRSDPLPGSNFLTGQVSIPRRQFEELGGFDETFNRDGSYGREDTDFGVRYERGGGRIIFAPGAISWQHYDVELGRYLRRRRQAGVANVKLLRKHPDLPEFVVKPNWRQGRFDRWIGRWLSRLVRPPVLFLLTRGIEPRILRKLFSWLHAHEYFRGVREAGGYPRRGPLRILAYHAIRDLSASSPTFARYGTTPDALRRQLRWLTRLGFHFIDQSELLRFLDRQAGLPRRAVLLTFDDAYADLAGEGLAALRDLGLPAMTFAVSGLIGGTNEWDSARGAPLLGLCTADQLRLLASQGISIGSHGRTHLALDKLSDDALANELSGSVADFESLGFERPVALAYPYGRADARVRAAARAAGFRVAFTVRPGIATPGIEPLDLPRIEILRGDRVWRFLFKIMLAGRSPFAPSRRRGDRHRAT